MKNVTAQKECCGKPIKWSIRWRKRLNAWEAPLWKRKKYNKTEKESADEWTHLTTVLSTCYYCYICIDWLIRGFQSNRNEYSFGSTHKLIVFNSQRSSLLIYGSNPKRTIDLEVRMWTCVPFYSYKLYTILFWSFSLHRHLLFEDTDLLLDFFSIF